MNPSPEADQLRRALDDFAGEVPNLPADVAGVVRAAHRRTRRRRVAGLAACCAVLLGPLLYAVLPAAAPPDDGRQVGAPPSLLTVDPGVKVLVDGRQLWLTADGKYCQGAAPPGPSSCYDAKTGPAPSFATQLRAHDHPENFGDSFALGTYRAPRTPVAVVTTVGGHTVRGTVLSLPDNPGWGVWYFVQHNTQLISLDPDLTFLDSGGRPIALPSRAPTVIDPKGSLAPSAAGSSRPR
ncbi:hypothetical protein [Streptomyces sp. CA-111067]|uniref:hypothetical protein n=1 Tax=Streptomyces sp. CA-111067 TaxID=3240046 RepID=UPI003D9A02B3